MNILMFRIKREVSVTRLTLLMEGMIVCIAHLIVHCALLSIKSSNLRFVNEAKAAFAEPPRPTDASRKELLSHHQIYAPIRSEVAIKLPIKVTISLLLKLVISSGTSQIVAPIFLAMEIASFAF